MLLLLCLIVLYLLLLIAVAWISLHPIRTPIFVSPGALGAPQENIEIRSDGITLRGWWVEAELPCSAMVLSHGYLMNRAELTPIAHHLWKKGVSCLLLDFRAHGKSGGRRCSLGYLEQNDVAAALRWTRTRIGPNVRLGVLGSSMGAAASALALANDPGMADLLVMDSAYSRLSSAVLGWFRFLGGRRLQIALGPSVLVCAPLAGFNPYSVDIAAALSKFGCKPVLHLHGSHDTLAPAAEASRNFDACLGAKRIVWFEGDGHTEGRFNQPGKYFDALDTFLEEHGFLPGA